MKSNFKIKSGRGYKKYYSDKLRPTVPFKVLKVAQDQSTGAEMGLIEFGKYPNLLWIIMYSSGDTATFNFKNKAEEQFEKHLKAGDLI